VLYPIIKTASDFISHMVQMKDEDDKKEKKKEKNFISHMVQMKGHVDGSL